VIKPGEGLTRKEREEAAKEKAREDYLRRYRDGETEQAQKDLARLAEVRARREEAARKKEEELKCKFFLKEGREGGGEGGEGLLALLECEGEAGGGGQEEGGEVEV
jgi:hypothetical protein